MNVVDIINGHYPCGCCGAKSRWMFEQPSNIRTESSIHWLRCAQCGTQVVAKISLDNGLPDASAERLRAECELLRELQSMLTADEHHGVLEPLAYFTAEGHGIMLTRRFHGADLAMFLRRANRGDACQASHAAGAWLRTLHTAGGERGRQTLGTQEKLEDLFGTYGDVLPQSGTIGAACRALRAHAERVERVVAVPVRIHGDFKPQNLLISPTRMVGLDIHWQSTGPAVYDLAPFLNHLWLLARPRPLAPLWRDRNVVAAAFLDGYGTAPDMRSLRWVRLYFALCHLGSYRSRGGAATIAARLLIQPLVHELTHALHRSP